MYDTGWSVPDLPETQDIGLLIWVLRTRQVAWNREVLWVYKLLLKS